MSSKASTEKSSVFSTGKTLIILIVSVALLVLQVTLCKAKPAIAMITTSFVVFTIELIFGKKWDEIEGNIIQVIKTMFVPLLIVLLVGVLIGSWMSSGTVPYMMYLGLKLMPPSIFLVAACLLCCLMSVFVGTSWGTVGTVGVALMGVSQAMGIPMGYTAGAVITGALFGDKLSPLSDTTVLCSSLCGTKLMDHVKSMLFTTIPALLFSLVLYFILGLQIGEVSLDSPQITGVLDTLNQSYNFNILLLLPVVIVLAMIFFHMPIILSFGAGIFSAGILAMLFQHRTLGQVLSALAGGLNISADAMENNLVRSMLNRGGLSSMADSALIIVCAALFIACIRTAGVAQLLEKGLRKIAKSRRVLLLYSYLLHLGLIAATGNYITGFTLVGPTLAPVFDKYQINRMNLSRMLEDTGTVVTPIVPWSVGSIFMCGTLGVTVAQFALYTPISYAGLVAAAIYIITGFAIFDPNGKMLMGKMGKKATQEAIAAADRAEASAGAEPEPAAQ